MEKTDEKTGASLTRRELVVGAGAAVMLGVAGCSDSGAADIGPVVYVGTYTAPNTAPGGTVPSTAQGIYVFRMDMATGGLTPLQTIATENPAYLAQHPTLSVLYACNETKPGAVSAYSIGGDGNLTFINSKPANGAWTTHVHAHPSGKYLLASNYGNGTETPGNVTVFALGTDGSIGAMTADFRGTGNGTGPNPDRQEAPHAHQVISDPGALRVFNVDLGADKVNILNLSLTTGALTANAVPFANTAAGSGPRHMAFHSNGKYAYVLNELVPTIDVFDYDATRGALVWKQSANRLPASWTGGKSGAEIRITPNGKFLYNTNRGHNSVGAYSIGTDGTLTLINTYTSGGDWPRGMAIDPTGTFLYAMNQNGNSILVYRIGADGGLTSTGITVNTPVPVDMVFGR